MSGEGVFPLLSCSAPAYILKHYILFTHDDGYAPHGRAASAAMTPSRRVIYRHAGHAKSASRLTTVISAIPRIVSQAGAHHRMNAVICASLAALYEIMHIDFVPPHVIDERDAS